MLRYLNRKRIESNLFKTVFPTAVSFHTFSQ